MPSNSFCFTEDRCQFELFLEKTPAQKVQFYVDKVPDSVNFISAIKEADNDGTRITLWFQFKKAGTYTLDPLVVTVGGKRQKIPFHTIIVYENLNTLRPELSVKFLNQDRKLKNNTMTITAGEHVGFTLYIRYAVQIISFNIDLPEDSVFNEIKRYAITEGNPRGTEFSPNNEPVAVFDWQPLVPGKWHFPPVKIKATGYNGLRYDLTLPEYTLIVTKSKQTKKQNQVQVKDDLFDYAFLESTDDTESEFKLQQDLSHAKKLQELRIKERHSFPFSKVSKERRQYEIDCGLKPAEDEPSQPFFLTVTLFSVLLIILIIVFLVFKKLALAGFCAFILVVILTGTTVYAVNISANSAVFIGNNIRAIPEEITNSTVIVQPGTCINVKRKAGNWVYIKCNETYGWVYADELLYIK